MRASAGTVWPTPASSAQRTAVETTALWTSDWPDTLLYSTGTAMGETIHWHIACFVLEHIFNQLLLLLLLCIMAVTRVFLSSSSELKTIFSNILAPHLSPATTTTTSPVVAAELADVGRGLVKVAVQVHGQLCCLFLPSPHRQHYLFNLRHMAAVFRQVDIA